MRIDQRMGVGHAGNHHHAQPLRCLHQALVQRLQAVVANFGRFRTQRLAFLQEFGMVLGLFRTHRVILPA